MIDNHKINQLIKEYLKDIALRMYEINPRDRSSLLAEYKEWIIQEFNEDEIMMLPFEAYTGHLIEEVNTEESN